MIFTVNSYSGYQYSGESKLLGPRETLEQALLLEHGGTVGIVPRSGKTKLGPFSDMNKDGARDGFAAEFTQGGVLVEPEKGRANVVAFTIDVAGQDDSGAIWLSSNDELRKSEEVWLDPTNASAEAKEGEGTPASFASVVGIAMPAMGKLLVVQMIPELPEHPEAQVA